MKKTWIVITLVGLAVLALGVGFAYAQEPDPASPEAVPGLVDKSALHDLVIAEIADALGIPADELQARLEAGERLKDIIEEADLSSEELSELMAQVRESVIAEALAQGLITEEQAERLEARGFRFGKGFGGRHRGFAMDGPLAGYMIDSLADALGLTPDELQTRIQAGERPEEIAEAQGLDADEARELLSQARADALEQAVADGVITQEEADRMLECGGDHHHGGRFGGGFGGAGGPGKGHFGPGVETSEG